MHALYFVYGPNVIFMRVAAAAAADAIGLLGARGIFHALSLWKQMSVFMSALRETDSFT